jgi:serine protease Do
MAIREHGQRRASLAIGLMLAFTAFTTATAAVDDTPPQRASDVGKTIVLDVPSIVEAVDSSVVSVDASGPDGRARGTGIIVDKRGLIITNFHVISLGDDLSSVRDEEKPIQLASAINVVLPDGRSVPASVKGYDRATDIALLSITVDQPLAEARLGDSDSLRVGEWVVAIGNPFGLEHTVTLGIISGKGRVGFGGQFDDFLQTDAAINPGNSGGPLVNARGEVIGIATLVLDPKNASGLSFAIPANLVRDIIPELATKGRVLRGFIGVQSADTNPRVRHALNLPAERSGILVERVERGTPAARAGLRQGDFIVLIDKTPVVNKGQFNRLIARKSPGTKVEITFVRGGKEYSIEAEVATETRTPRLATEEPEQAN